MPREKKLQYDVRSIAAAPDANEVLIQYLDFSALVPKTKHFSITLKHEWTSRSDVVELAAGLVQKYKFLDRSNASGLKAALRELKARYQHVLRVGVEAFAKHRLVRSNGVLLHEDDEVFELQGDKVTCDSADGTQMRFGVDGCFGRDDFDNDRLFERAVRPGLHEFISGNSATVLCYGATRSGKTDLVFGNDSTNTAPSILSRVFEYLFVSLGLNLPVQVSMIEMTPLSQFSQAGPIHDLLCIPKKPLLPEPKFPDADLAQRVFFDVSSVEDARKVLDRGLRRGNLRTPKSRDHTTIITTLELAHPDDQWSRLNIVKLAGSEIQESPTHGQFVDSHIADLVHTLKLVSQQESCPPDFLGSKVISYALQDMFQAHHRVSVIGCLGCDDDSDLESIRTLQLLSTIRSPISHDTAATKHAPTPDQSEAAPETEPASPEAGEPKTKPSPGQKRSNRRWTQHGISSPSRQKPVNTLSDNDYRSLISRLR